MTQEPWTNLYGKKSQIEVVAKVGTDCTCFSATNEEQLLTTGYKRMFPVFGGVRANDYRMCTALDEVRANDFRMFTVFGGVRLND